VIDVRMGEHDGVDVFRVDAGLAQAD